MLDNKPKHKSSFQGQLGMSSMHLSYRRNHWLTKTSTKYCGTRKEPKCLCSEQHACVTSKKIAVQLSASAIAKVTHVAKAGRTQCMRVTDVRHADKYARSMDVLGFVDATSRCTLTTAVMHTVTASITVAGIRGSDSHRCSAHSDRKQNRHRDRRQQG